MSDFENFGAEGVEAEELDSIDLAGVVHKEDVPPLSPREVDGYHTNEDLIPETEIDADPELLFAGMSLE